MKIAVVSCYKYPDYVRITTLRAAIAALPDHELIIVSNRHRGWLRFIEVPLKLLKARWTAKPDAWLITFRGYEMLLFLVLSFTRRPIIFDELINFTEWMEEHHHLKVGSLSYRLFRRWYGWLVGHCRLILADTEAHARYSAKLNRLPIDRYQVVPVGAEETLFYPSQFNKPKNKPFTVLYYGNMLPLHGLNYVLEAALLLKDEPIEFCFVGGKSKTAKACAVAAADGAQVKYHDWLPLTELVEMARAAQLVLGGPFGGTLQSQFVITGKTTQALALGVPVLIGLNQATNLFSDKHNCLMVEQANAKALAEAIKWSLSHPNELASIATAGRNLYEAHFAQAKTNQIIAKMFSDLENIS